MATADHAIPKNLPLDSADMMGLPLREIRETNWVEITVAIIEAKVSRMVLVLHNQRFIQA